MKFGKTNDEKLDRRIKIRERKSQMIYRNISRFFALIPVKLNSGKYIWLERYYKINLDKNILKYDQIEFNRYIKNNFDILLAHIPTTGFSKKESQELIEYIKNLYITELNKTKTQLDDSGVKIGEIRKEDEEKAKEIIETSSKMMSEIINDITETNKDVNPIKKANEIIENMDKRYIKGVVENKSENIDHANDLL